MFLVVVCFFPFPLLLVSLNFFTVSFFSLLFLFFHFITDNFVRGGSLTLFLQSLQCYLFMRIINERGDHSCGGESHKTCVNLRSSVLVEFIIESQIKGKKWFKAHSFF